MFGQTIYPETMKKLESAGLVERIKKVKRGEDAPYFGGFVSDDDLQRMSFEMQKEGFYSPKNEEQKQVAKKLQRLLMNMGEEHWRVHRHEGLVKGKVETEDVQNLMGQPASFVLSPKEMWDYNKFGFDSVSDFVGSVSLLMCKGGLTFRGGYQWETNSPDGKVITNQITGSEHGDLRMLQTDITPYDTVNPLGDKSGYRPEMSEDQRGVSGYHSVEGHALIAVLKYIEQLGLDREFLKDAKKITERAIEDSEGVPGVAATSSFSEGDLERPPMVEFSLFHHPIPQLNEDYTVGGPSDYNVFTEFRGIYDIFVGPNRELVFSREKDKETRFEKVKRKREVSAIYLPTEAEHLVRGLFYQSAASLGRTPVRYLENIVRYRYSGEYEKDMKELEEYKTKMKKS